MAASRRKPDPIELLRELAAFGDYPNTEQGALAAYADFRAVFLSDDRGKRVLNQILGWSHIMRSCADPEPIQMAFMNGERNIGLRVLTTIEIEPKPRPARASSKRASTDD